MFGKIFSMMFGKAASKPSSKRRIGSEDEDTASISRSIAIPKTQPTHPLPKPEPSPEHSSDSENNTPRSRTPPPGFPPSDVEPDGRSADESVGMALPPPKRRKPCRALESAEDWCLTDVNWKEINYTWTINSFSKCQEELGNYITSPDFPSAPSANDSEMAFYLKVHLRGENETSDHLAVYIVCKGMEEVLATFELSILVDGAKLNVRDSKKMCHFAENHHPAWGFKKFIKFEELQDIGKASQESKPRIYLEGDCLTLHCDVKYIIMKNLRPLHQNRGEAMIKPGSCVEEGMERLDIDQLWRDRQYFSDIIIICQGKELRANKVLLSARSKVFCAMFSHPMRESQSGKIDVNDIDPNVFEQMLCYMYTGFVPDIEKFAEELLIAANKYALEELKTSCVRVLENKLNHENVLYMLALAESYLAKTLKDAALHFLAQHLDLFMDKNFKVQWHKFNDTHPLLMKETVKFLLEWQPNVNLP